MDNVGRLYSQVAAQADVSPEKAQVAVYLYNLAQQGKSIGDACRMTRMERPDVRNVARDWGFQFTDYAPSLPLPLEWHKVKRGIWELRLPDGTAVADMKSNHGDYVAEWRGGGNAESGSKPEVAARRLSIEIERQSLKLFGVDDVAIGFTGPDGVRERLAPEVAANSQKFAEALAA